VTNLVSNAIKFTPRGGRVYVRVHPDGALAVVEVEDTGQGIEPESIGALFECYQQNCAPATARAGLGLGLYIVRQLVQLHGGMVEASSPGVGRGSKLTVRLPLRETTPSVASERLLPDESTRDLDGVRVLVVEDEPDALELLTTVLAGRGANVSAASDASQALAMFESCRPDVVVSDIEMPGKDGCALIVQLKECADVPAIAVSGFAGKEDAERALRAGFDVHVSKPIDPRELVHRIRALSARPRRN
jgi:CheY-like chemotaxis protein/anti-sigma regulatory factor (Ser/Thr protein kinase)